MFSCDTRYGGAVAKEFPWEIDLGHVKIVLHACVLASCRLVFLMPVGMMNGVDLVPSICISHPLARCLPRFFFHSTHLNQYIIPHWVLLPREGYYYLNEQLTCLVGE